MEVSRFHVLNTILSHNIVSQIQCMNMLLVIVKAGGTDSILKQILRNSTETTLLSLYLPPIHLYFVI